MLMNVTTEHLDAKPKEDSAADVLDEEAAAFIDVYFHHAEHDTNRVMHAIRLLASDAQRWEAMENESALYCDGIDRCGIILRDCHGKENAVIAIAGVSKSVGSITMYIANIVSQLGRLSSNDYNTIAIAFASDLRHSIRKHGIAVHCSCNVPKSPSTLKEIITGDRTRRLFERYLMPGGAWGTAPITHPLDIERLDQFFCRVSERRARVHWEALAVWLMRERSWSEEEAGWLVRRANIAMGVLRAKQKRIGKFE